MDITLLTVLNLLRNFIITIIIIIIKTFTLINGIIDIISEIIINGEAEADIIIIIIITIIDSDIHIKGLNPNR